MTLSRRLKRWVDRAFHKVFGLTDGGVTLNAQNVRSIRSRDRGFEGAASRSLTPALLADLDARIRGERRDTTTTILPLPPDDAA